MTDTRSRAAILAALDPVERDRLLSKLSKEDVSNLRWHWPLWARPSQLPPAGDWRTWLFLAGRGSGKTRAACEWIRSEIESGRRRNIGIIGPTSTAVRRIQIEGSGLLSVSPPWCKPVYESTLARVSYPNGATCWLCSSEEESRIRGFNWEAAWVDELAVCENLNSLWSNLNMAVRVPGPLGHAPQIFISTTPRPLPLLKQIMADPTTVITRARTMDNAANLDPSTLEFLHKTYGHTRLGAQELEGLVIDDVDGALFSRDLLESVRVSPFKAPRHYRRIVVAVDPAMSSNATSDETGVIVAGLSEENGEAYVIADYSGRYSPDKWAKIVVDAYHTHSADRIITEVNAGGDLVESVIRSRDPTRTIPIRKIHAKRGKVARAEPVVALMEQGRAHLIGRFDDLESQLTGWSADSGTGSPDRMDALVYAIHELMIRPRPVLVERAASPVSIPIFAR